MLLNHAQVKHSAVLQTRGRPSNSGHTEALTAAETTAVPRLAVDGGAVEEGGQEMLPGTEAAEHQTDPVDRRQPKHGEGHEETAVVRLSNTAVNPAEPHPNKTVRSHS